jgi:hypothetical protein
LDSELVAKKIQRLFARFDKMYTHKWRKEYTSPEEFSLVSEGYATVITEIDPRKIAKALEFIASSRSDYNSWPPKPLELKELAISQNVDEPRKIEPPPKTKVEALWELFFSEVLCEHYHGDKTVIACEISALRVDIPGITQREFDILSGSPFSKAEINSICNKYKIYLSFVQTLFLEKLTEE